MLKCYHRANATRLAYRSIWHEASQAPFTPLARYGMEYIGAGWLFVRRAVDYPRDKQV